MLTGRFSTAPQMQPVVWLCSGKAPNHIFEQLAQELQNSVWFAGFESQAVAMIYHRQIHEMLGSIRSWRYSHSRLSLQWPLYSQANRNEYAPSHLPLCDLWLTQSQQRLSA